MRIAIFSAFYPFRGGIAQFNNRLAQELMKTDEVQCFTFEKQYPSLLFPGKTQLDDSSIEKITAIQTGNPFQPLSYRKAARTINESHPEILVMNFWMSFFAPFKGIITKNLNKEIKKVALVHNLVPHEKRFFDKTLISFFTKQFDNYIVLSEAVRNDVLRYKPKANIKVLYHPIYDQFGSKEEQLKARTQLKLDPQKKTLLFFGLIRDYKGLDTLIEAFNSLDDTYQLLIAGEVYNKEDKYNDLIQHSKNRERIHYYNHFISDQEVSHFFSAADLVVLPYKSATQSGVTAVATHFEVPVLVTNVGGLKEYVEHNKTGVLIDKSTASDVLSGIQHYFNDLNHQEIATNLKTHKQRLSWERFAGEFRIFLSSINEK